MLTDDDAKATELAWACERALSGLSAGQGRLPRSAWTVAHDVLARFSEAASPRATVAVMLAARILVHFNDPMNGRNLRKALDAALKMSEGSVDDITHLQRVLVRCLAELAPGELLDYPPDCDCVHSALRQLAVERAWLIYHDRIVGTEGLEIASSADSRDAAASVTQAPDLKAVIDLLPPRSQRVLYSYWLMVREGGPCRPRDSEKSIYVAIQSRLDGTIPDALTPQLDALFADELPKFDTCAGC